MYFSYLTTRYSRLWIRQPPPGFPMPGFPPSASPFPPGGPPLRPPFPPPPFLPPVVSPPSGIFSPPPPPQFVPAQQTQPSAPAPPPHEEQQDVRSDVPSRQPILTLPNPSLAQTNPEFKKTTDLKVNDPNFSPVHFRSLCLLFFVFLSVGLGRASCYPPEILFRAFST